MLHSDSVRDTWDSGWEQDQVFLLFVAGQMTNHRKTHVAHGPDFMHHCLIHNSVHKEINLVRLIDTR